MQTSLLVDGYVQLGEKSVGSSPISPEDEMEVVSDTEQLALAKIQV